MCFSSTREYAIVIIAARYPRILTRSEVLVTATSNKDPAISLILLLLHGIILQQIIMVIWIEWFSRRHDLRTYIVAVFR